MNDLLKILTREGVLLSVSVRYWRGCKKLRPEDLGLNPRNLSDRLISLGHKRLLPKEATAALALVESRAHALVESNTFPFLNGLAHFLPNTKLAEVTDKLKELQTEFWAAKATFLEQYGSLREAALKEWRTMAQKLSDNADRVLATYDRHVGQFHQGVIGIMIDNLLDILCRPGPGPLGLGPANRPSVGVARFG